MSELSTPASAAVPVTVTMTGTCEDSFPVLQNDCILRAAKGQPTARIPIWVMRQAGRYLPEYKAFTADKDFFQVCQTPAWACEVTLQPIRRFDLDAAIIFSDILVIPQALGMSITMQPGVGPVFAKPLRSPADWSAVLNALRKPPSQPSCSEGDSSTDSSSQSHHLHQADDLVSPSLNYVYEAITLTRKSLQGKVPLIGFCGSPWTLFVYMTEGKSSRLFCECKRWLYLWPSTSQEVLALLTEMCIAYLLRQIKAGAQLLQVFDSHGGVLNPSLYREFNLPTLQKIAAQVKAQYPEIPLIIFSKDAHFAVPDLATSAYDVVSLDASMALGETHSLLQSHRKAVQGNLDPGALYASARDLQARVTTMLTEVSASPHKQGNGGNLLPLGYIANLGHGMNPDHDPEQLKVFIDTVHSFRITNSN